MRSLTRGDVVPEGATKAMAVVKAMMRGDAMPEKAMKAMKAKQVVHMKAKKAMKVLKAMLAEGEAAKKAMKAPLMKAAKTMKGKLATAEAAWRTRGRWAGPPGSLLCFCLNVFVVPMKETQVREVNHTVTSELLGSPKSRASL